MCLVCSQRAPTSGVAAHRTQWQGEKDSSCWRVYDTEQGAADALSAALASDGPVNCGLARDALTSRWWDLVAEEV